MIQDKTPTTVLALDPGGHTGWAIYDNGHFRSGEFTGPFEEQALKLCDLFYYNNPAQVVCESYTITQRTAKLSQQHEAIMLIGMTRWFVNRAHTQLAMQTPATAKSFATDAKLKVMNWYRSANGHANDAARHLLTWLAMHDRLDTETMKALAAA